MADLIAKPIGRSTAFEDLPEYLTPEEVRVYLNLGRNQTYDWLRTLPCIRCGRLIRVPKAVLRAGQQ